MSKTREDQNERFNFEMLETARNYRGLSQTQAAKKCGMSQPKFSKIANGIVDPNMEEVEKFSSVLDFPISFFSINSRAIGIPMSFHEMHRSPKSIGVKQQAVASADLTIRLICIAKLLSGVDIEAETRLPQYDIEDYNDAQEIAQLTRRTWLLPPGPIVNLTSLIEKAGVIVFQCYLPIKKIDGVTVNISGLPPVIFLNNLAPADRMRHSLAHELGHVIMHRQMTNTMEDEANEFAAELLLPERELKAEFSGGVDLRRLAELKRVWRVSMGSLLYRAKRIGSIDKNRYDYLIKQMSARRWRTQEPMSTMFEKEEPFILKDMIDMYIKHMSYSPDDLSSMFCLHQPMTKQLFEGLIKESGRLRLVV